MPNAVTDTMTCHSLQFSFAFTGRVVIIYTEDKIAITALLLAYLAKSHSDELTSF